MFVFLSLRRMTDELYPGTNPTPHLSKWEESGDHRTTLDLDASGQLIT